MSEPITKRFNFREFFGQAFASAVSPDPTASPTASSGSCSKGGSCGCASTPKPPASLLPLPSQAPSGGCGNGGSCGCASTPKPSPSPAPERGLNRRQAIQAAVTGIAAAGATGCSTSDDPETKRKKRSSGKNTSKRTIVL